jgi:CRP/FNR family transcriptional regulator, cyclic AMP receptor protein
MMKSTIARRSAVTSTARELRHPFEIKAFVAKYGGTANYKIRAKHAIYSQGEPADCVIYIQKGEAQVTVVSKHGKEAVIAVLEAGDLCGEGCLIGETLRLSTITAMTECVIARLDKATVNRAIHEDLAFAEFFSMYTLNQSAKLRDNLIDQLFNSSEKRLARILLLLTNFGQEGRSETVIKQIDQQTLARMVGTTRSRINFFMNKFRRLGYIEYNGRISVHSSLLGVVLHDQSSGELKKLEPGAA